MPSSRRCRSRPATTCSISAAAGASCSCGFSPRTRRRRAPASTPTGRRSTVACGRRRAAACTGGSSSSRRPPRPSSTSPTSSSAVASSHAFGGTGDALHWLRQSVTPGGRVLFGDGFWAAEPSAAAIATIGELPRLRGAPRGRGRGGLPDRARRGLRPRRVGRVRSRAGGRASRCRPTRRRWRSRRERRREYEEGYREAIGFAWLVLAPRVRGSAAHSTGSTRQLRRHHLPPVALVGDVDGVVLAVRAGDAERDRGPADQPELPFLLHRPLEQEVAVAHDVVGALALEHPVHEHLERPHDVGREADARLLRALL